MPVAPQLPSPAMDFELSDEQRLIRETARAFTDNEIVERARENDRNEHFDLELVSKIAEQGYLGAIVPREYGGAGLDYVTYGLIVEEIGRGDSAMRTVVSVQTSLVCSAALRASWSTPTSRASNRRKSTTRWDCTVPTRHRSRSTTSRRARIRCSARSVTASRSR